MDISSKIEKNEINITSKIMNIERLKSNILLDIANINMLLANNNDDDLDGRIADIIINSYILGDKIGFSFENINSKIADKLRLHALDDNNSLQLDYIKFSKYINS